MVDVLHITCVAAGGLDRSRCLAALRSDEFHLPVVGLRVTCPGGIQNRSSGLRMVDVTAPFSSSTTVMDKGDRFLPLTCHRDRCGCRGEEKWLCYCLAGS